MVKVSDCVVFTSPIVDGELSCACVYSMLLNCLRRDYWLESAEKRPRSDKNVTEMSGNVRMIPRGRHAG